jgi:hypothetical protein
MIFSAFVPLPEARMAIFFKVDGFFSRSKNKGLSPKTSPNLGN